MRIKVDLNSKVVKYEDGNIHSVEPIINADIDVNKEELDFIYATDKELWNSMISMLTHTCDEITRQIQTS